MDFGSINMDCARLRLISMDFASPHEKGRKRPTPAQYSLLSSLLKSRLNAAEEVNHANHEQDAIPVFGLLATLGVFVGKRRSTRGVSFVAALAAWLLQFYLARLRARRAITLRNVLEAEATQLTHYIQTGPPPKKIGSPSPSTRVSERGTQTDAVAASTVPPPPPPPPPIAAPPPPPPPLAFGRPPPAAALARRPTAQELMGVCLKKAAASKPTTPSKKRAADLAGARPAGGLTVTVEQLEGVKLKAAAKASEEETAPKIKSPPAFVKARSRLKAVGNENANEEVAAKAVVVQPPKARGRGKPLSPINAVSPTKASEPAAAPEPGPLRRLFFR